MKIFVVGGTGAVGLPALRELVKAGHEVTSTARTDDKARVVRELGAAPKAVNVYDTSALRAAVHRFDAVVRLTTRIPSLTKLRNPRAWEETNRLRTEGARALVNACIAEGIGLYVSESVSFVYADGGDRFLDEDAPVDDGNTTILRAALESEREGFRIAEAGGRAVVLRFGGFYGPEAPSTREMARMLWWWLLPQIGDGLNYFSSIFVADAGRSVAASLEAPTGRYNIVDDEPVLFKDYLRTMARALRAPPPLRMPRFLGPLMFGRLWRYLSRSQRLSSAAFKKLTRWSPEVKSVKQGCFDIARNLR